jgi:hypothetical protein
VSSCWQPPLVLFALVPLMAYVANERGYQMLLLHAFPVLAVVVAAYNFIVVLGSRSVGDVLREVTLPSGAIWPMTVGDVFVMTALVLVLIELASVGSGRASVVNHALSAVVFMICIAELLFVRGCGTAEFVLITLIVGLDVVAGYSLTARLARRNLELERQRLTRA